MVRHLLTCLAALVLLLTACTSDAAVEQGRTTNTTSDDIETVAERIAFASTYVNFASEPIDVEFDIWYQDNSVGRVPGPSDWDMRMVFVVNPAEIGAWIDDGQSAPRHDIDWSLRFLENKSTVSPQEHFWVNGNAITIYRAEGLVLKRIATTES